MASAYDRERFFSQVMQLRRLTALPNLTTMDRHMQNAYSRQASVEVEQQLGPRSTVSVGYQYVRGLDLIMSVNQNVPTLARLLPLGVSFGQLP